MADEGDCLKLKLAELYIFGVNVSIKSAMVALLNPASK